MLMPKPNVSFIYFVFITFVVFIFILAFKYCACFCSCHFFFENYVHVIFAKLIVKKERKKNDRGMDLITVEIVYTGSNYF